MFGRRRRSKTAPTCGTTSQPTTQAAARLDALFSDAAARLADYPKLGRAGVIPGTYELIPHENYRLVYEIERETVWVLALAHTGKQWPPVRE